MTKTYYPLLDEAWLRRFGPVSDEELSAALRSGYLYSDAKEGVLFDSSGHKDEKIDGLLKEKYFKLLLINLYEKWFSVPCPKRALEFLVLDFWDTSSIHVFDNMLPSGVAGISEIEEPSEFFDVDIFKSNVAIHKWLAGYVTAIVDQNL